ncbi:MAG TPA: cation:proton antiporter [Paraburkholderia sp.]|jgi:NhaP-type Na+/H+ or K+/H+ antiporter|nr:cation:proton antiporter [Paraburkholderia sp.]
MYEALWFILVGGVLVVMALAASTLKQLPCSASMFYLVIGFALGAPVANFVQFDLMRDAHALRVVTEIALLVSLFAIGLRLRVDLGSRLWRLPVRLGIVAMAITVPLLALAAIGLFALTWGPALLLAAILAPTDPVLAHDVQVRDPGDLDFVRFALSAEGGVNDGIAMPFALFALALSAHHEPLRDAGVLGLFVLHALWGIVGALLIGALLAWLMTHTVAFLRTHYEKALGLEGFFALGLIALSFGCAQFVDAYGFIAVFAAGVTMRRVEHRASGSRRPDEVVGKIDTTDVTATASHPGKAHAYMTQSVLGFTIELERIAEAAVMTVAGNVVAGIGLQVFAWPNLVLAALLFLAIRPLAVVLTLAGSPASRTQRRLIGWFGIRGIGSVYYLAYAFEQGPVSQVAPLAAPALGVIVASVVVHGVSAAPLMGWYQRLRARED